MTNRQFGHFGGFTVRHFVIRISSFKRSLPAVAGHSSFWIRPASSRRRTPPALVARSVRQKLPNIPSMTAVAAADASGTSRQAA